MPCCCAQPKLTVSRKWRKSYVINGICAQLRTGLFLLNALVHMLLRAFCRSVHLVQLIGRGVNLFIGWRARVQDRPTVRWWRATGQAQRDSWAGCTGHSHLDANLQELSSELTSGRPYYTFTILSTEPHHVRLGANWNYVAFFLGNLSGLQQKKNRIVFELFQGNNVALKQATSSPPLFSLYLIVFVQIMYVGYLLDKESGMYHQGPVRRSSINLPPQNFVSTPQYPDFTGYHHVPNMDTHAQSSGSWGPTYGAPREDWGAYSLGPPNTIPTPMNNSSPAQVPYCSSEYSHMHPPGSAVLQPPPENVTVAQLSPDRERRNSYQWMSKTAQSSSTGEIEKPQLCAKIMLFERKEHFPFVLREKVLLSARVCPIVPTDFTREFSIITIHLFVPCQLK